MSKSDKRDPHVCAFLCGPHLLPCVFWAYHPHDCECGTTECREIASLKRSFWPRKEEPR